MSHLLNDHVYVSCKESVNEYNLTLRFSCLAILSLSRERVLANLDGSLTSKKIAAPVYRD